MNLSVPFANIFNPNKFFDSFDHRDPHEKFLTHLRPRVTFQFGPQPLDISIIFNMALKTYVTPLLFHH